MKHIRPSLLVTLVVGAVVLQAASTDGKKATPRQPDPAKDQAEIALIKKMEEDRVQAGVVKDIDAIAAVTAEDYVQIDFDGKVLDKSATMRRIKSSEIQLQSNSLDDMLVRIFDNTAVVTARSTPKGTMSGRDFGNPIRYTRVYVKSDGRWKVVVFQMTRVAGDK